jgi:hypothetical protein
VCLSCEPHTILGCPAAEHIGTSYIKSENLSVRMTNVALGYFAHNFTKIHRPLRVTPAMAAGVTDKL